MDRWSRIVVKRDVGKRELFFNEKGTNGKRNGRGDQMKKQSERAYQIAQ